MSENKRFKAFRNTLTESEYKETLTGYPNRGIDTEDGPVNFGPQRMAQINAMLNAISRSTFQSPNEAFIKIKTRLNLLLLDFPWTPYLWQDGGTGPVTLTVTLFGRVDGVDGISGNIGPTNGKANPTAGLKEFTLLAFIEIAEDGLYRVNAKLMPKVDVVVAEEGVEHDGDSLDEMAQTAAREAEIKRKKQKHDDAAQRAYDRRMTGSLKQQKRALKSEIKHDKSIERLIKRDWKEQDSPRTYGRGGKLIKRGSRREVKEEVEAIDELLTPMRDRITARELDKATADYNNPNLSSAQQKKAGARASRATYARLRARSHDGTVAGKSQTPKFKRENEKWRKVEKSVKEGVEAIEEMHKPGDTVKVPHKGKMVRGKIVRHDKGGSSKAAQHGGGYVVDVGEYGSITVPSHKIVKEGVEQIDEAGAAKAARLAKAKERAGREGDADRFERASAVQKRIIDRLHKKKARVGAVSEELVGGQKKLDVNKNKRLDAQDFKMLRAKKKPVQEEAVSEAKKFKAWTPRLDKLMKNRDAVRSKPKKTVKEYTEMMPGISLQVPDPTEAHAGDLEKGKRFHKKALKTQR